MCRRHTNSHTYARTPGTATNEPCEELESHHTAMHTLTHTYAQTPMERHATWHTYQRICSRFPLMSTVCIGRTKSRRNVLGGGDCLLFVERYQRIWRVCAEAGQSDMRVYMFIWISKRFFSLCFVEHLKQVWLQTFTTKQKGAHCQTFWLFVHNASISRLVSAQLFVCSVRLSKLNDYTEKSSKKIKKV